MKKFFVLLVLCLALVFIRYNFNYIAKRRMPKLSETYVINLDQSKDRLKVIGKSLNDAKIPYKRFSATLGTNVRITDEKTGKIFSGLDLKNGTASFNFGDKYIIHCGEFDIKYIFDKSGLNRAVTAGEIGCTCSHLRVMNDIIKNGHAYSLILEDDVIIPIGLLNDLNNLSVPEKPFDLLYLAYRLQVGSVIKPIIPLIKVQNIPFNDDIVKITKIKAKVFFTRSYIVSLDGAKKIFEYGINSGKFGPSDDMISSAIINADVVAFATKKIGLGVRDIESIVDTIGGERKVDKK